MPIQIELDATRVIALIGACTGVASLAWNIHTKVAEGPKLRLRAWANNVEIPPGSGNPKFVRVTVQNIGTKATTITNFGLYTFDSRWKQFKRKSNFTAIIKYKGPQCPHQLDVGGEVTVLVQSDEKLEPMLKAEEMWAGVHHSFSPKADLVKIIYPIFKSDKVAEVKKSGCG